jgi:hypothetical protein
MPIAIILRSAEARLVEMLSTIRDPSGWHAVHFRLSDLLEQYKNEYQIKIAVNLINDLLKTYEGGIYLFQDSSIVVLCNQLERPVLNKLVFQLRYLYMDDPLAYTDEGHENPDFCTIYELARDWNVFFDWCSQRMAAVARKQAQPTAPQPMEAMSRVPQLESHAAPRSLPQPLAFTPKSEVLAGGHSFSARLSFIEQDVRQSDIASAIRRQPVCSVAKNLSIRRVFDEVYIHIAQLRQLLRSEVDFLSNRWLFKYLTHVLDERILAHMQAERASLEMNPVSLNINAETVLSSAFEQFDAAIPAALKASVVLEIPVMDVFADMSGFELAREQAQKMGYRICLDGLNARGLMHINRTQLAVDLLKLQWNAEAESDIMTARNQPLLQAVQQAGANRLILCRCDSRAAVDFGHALGISLFQGRFIDSLINPSLRVAN